VLKAVLFDWNNTLVQFTWDDELLLAGHRAALAASQSEQDPDGFTARYRELDADPSQPRAVDWVSGAAVWLRCVALDVVGA